MNKFKKALKVKQRVWSILMLLIEKIITQPKTTDKMISHHTRVRENDVLSLWRGPAAKKKLSRHFLMRAH